MDECCHDGELETAVRNNNSSVFGMILLVNFKYFLQQKNKVKIGKNRKIASFRTVHPGPMRMKRTLGRLQKDHYWFLHHTSMNYL